MYTPRYRISFTHVATVTTQALQKLRWMGRNDWRGKHWGDLGKQAYRGCGRDMSATVWRAHSIKPYWSQCQIKAHAVTFHEKLLSRIATNWHMATPLHACSSLLSSSVFLILPHTDSSPSESSAAAVVVWAGVRIMLGLVFNFRAQERRLVRTWRVRRQNHRNVGNKSDHQSLCRYTVGL